MKKARFTWDPFSTHQPVLYEALLRTEGNVVEFGCGDGSTRMLHELCERQGKHLWTFDTDWKWLGKYTDYATKNHEIIFVDNWDTFLREGGGRRSWMYCDVAFIDQGPFEARAVTVQLLKETARFLVVHDCDYFPGTGLFGFNLDPINGIEHPGHRTYEDVFQYWKEFFPLEPWPHPPTGPPILVASNYESVDDWEVDFEKYVSNELLIELGEERNN